MYDIMFKDYIDRVSLVVSIEVKKSQCWSKSSRHPFHSTL